MAVNLTLMNLPEALYESIKRAAATHQRTMDGEAIAWLESVAPPERIDTATRLARIRKLRGSLNVWLTDEDIDRFKREGRE